MQVRNRPPTNIPRVNLYEITLTNIIGVLIMGKTGTTLWAQVKGVKGQIRLVPKREGELKKPGPNQRFRAGITVKIADQLTQTDGRAGGSRGRSRGGRGGRGRMDGSGPASLNRHRMMRPKVSALGAKQKSSR